MQSCLCLLIPHNGSTYEWTIEYGDIGREGTSGNGMVGDSEGSICVTETNSGGALVNKYVWTLRYSEFIRIRSSSFYYLPCSSDYNS